MKKTIAPGIAIVTSLAAICFLLLANLENQPDSKQYSSNSSIPSLAPGPISDGHPDTPISSLAVEFALISEENVTASVLAAAEERKQLMLDMMREDPARALANAVSWTDYANLPDVLLPFFEKPFNTIATLEVFPVCNAPSRPGRRTITLEGKIYEANVFGARLAHGSKTSTPLSGITLDDRAVIAEEVLRILSPEDRRTLESAPLANSDPSRDFATGEKFNTEPITALAGGQRFLFGSAAEVDEFNQRLASLDARPGPNGGARALFEVAYPSEASVGFDWPAAEAWSNGIASSWTETPKNVFFIRVDFPDKPGESVSQTALESLLNTDVSQSVVEMSYGKTAISANVSAMVVRLPSPSTSYAPYNESLLYGDARAGYLAIAGPNALNGYDIVGVHFTSIGIRDYYTGVAINGLATLGGSKQWLQNTTSARVVVHEFGHNYGVDHAGRWSTSDSSVVGSGSSVEYGDPFDIMGGGPAPSGHFHMQGKAYLNWLTSSQWSDATVGGSGVRRLRRFDSPDTPGAGVPRGLRVLKGGTNNTAAAEYYWIGYRPGIESNPWLQRGAYLIWERSNTDRGWLLDTTPGSVEGAEDSALRLGRTFSDPIAKVHVTPIATGGSGADSWIDVNVQLGAFPGNISPSATFAPPSQLAARSAHIVAVNASDANGDSLSYSWDFGDGKIIDSIPSVSYAWTVGGTYSINVIVSDMKGGIVARNASVTVSDPLDEWTTSTIFAGRKINEIAYLRGRFIAGGDGRVYISLDGRIWEEVFLSDNHRSGGLAADAEGFVLVGGDYDFNLRTRVSSIRRSSDGRIWQRVSSHAGGELRDVVQGDGVFVAVGDGGTILRSADGGMNWSPVSAPGEVSLTAVAHGSGFFIAVGGNAVYTSPDGLIWTDRSDLTLLLTNHTFRDVVYSGGAFYAGGRLSGIHRTIDGGLTWTKVGVPNNETFTISSLAAGSGVIVASGRRLVGTPVQLVSTDGVLWQKSAGTISAETDSITHGPGFLLSTYGSEGISARSGLIVSDNQAPTASVSVPVAGFARVPMDFSTTADDPNGDPLALIWDFGDGSAFAEGLAVSHTYSRAGTYNVKLTAVDHRGGIVTESRSIVVTIAQQPDNWIGLKRGSQQGDNTYNGSGLRQQVNIRLKSGHRVSVYATVQNDGKGSDIVSVKATRSNRDFLISYFEMSPTRRNVTSAISGRGHETKDLASSASVEFIVQITSKKRPARKSILITSTSRSQISARDAVRAVVTVRP